jgi:hypothetical protein
MTNSLPILIALGINDVIGILVTAAFFVVWLINQINDAKKKQAAQAARPQAAAPPPPQPAQANAAAGAPPPADPLRGQIDEFLRRAAQQKLPQQAPPQPSKKPPGRDEVVVLLDEQIVAAPTRKTLADTMRTKDDASAARRDKPARPPRERKSASRQPAARQPSASVADHVSERIGTATQDFRDEVADLGQRVKQADQQFDEQLNKKFDHALGSFGEGHLAGTGGQQPIGKATTPAAQIAAMLASPDGVRQAIMLNEILNRPTDRW